MKETKRFWGLLIGGLVFLSAAAHAQDTARVERTITMLREKLSLSDAQTAQVRDILSSYAAEMGKTTRGSATASRLQPKSVSKSLKALDLRIDAVLSPEQRAKYPGIRKELHSRLDPRLDRSSKRKQ